MGIFLSQAGWGARGLHRHSFPGFALSLSGHKTTAQPDSQQLQRRHLDDTCSCTGWVLVDSAGHRLFPQRTQDGLEGPGHTGHHLSAVDL